MKHQNKNFLMGFLAAMTFININAFAQWTGTNPIWTNSNVGIGTSTPWGQLDVFKDQNDATRMLISNQNLGTNASAELVVQSFPSANVRLGVTGYNNTTNGLCPKKLTSYLYSNQELFLITYFGDMNLRANQSINFYSSMGVFAKITPWNTFGIGTSTPIQTLDVNGRINVNQGVIQKGGAAITGTSDMGLYSLTPATFMRFVTNGAPFRFFADGGTNPTGGTSLFNIEANGNIGIGATSPGFPLNFANILGDKISLWGNSGSHYGFGIQGGLLQIHTDLSGSDIAFGYGTSASFTETMRIKGNGKVGIGVASTAMPGNYKLYVKGGILTELVRVAVSGTSNWADYVFNSDYKLRSITDLENYIVKNKHLPNIPSAEDVVKDGIDIAQMDAKLLEKIEELTLYIVDLQKQINALKK